MKVLVDTCIWSRALRHKSPDRDIEQNLDDLIEDARAALIGPIRQELLSGISKKVQFNQLKEALSAFEDIQLTTTHFIQAAEFCNTCRRKGVQGSTTDFLICSVASLENMAVYTVDKDFQLFSKHLPFELLQKF